MSRRFYRWILCMILTASFFASCVFCVKADIGPEDGGSTTPVEIVDPVNEIDSFSAVVYNNANGLPTSEANDITQTSDGFIWIGSYSGLIRYDGNTFERMDANTTVPNAVCLFSDPKNRLWIGTNDSGVALYENNTFRKWTVKDGLRSNKINSIAQDASGMTYLGTATGISVIDRNMNVINMQEPELQDAYIVLMRNSPDGSVYGLTNDDAVFSIRNGVLTNYLRSDELGVSGVTCILPDPVNPSRMYIGTQGSEFYYGNPFIYNSMTRLPDIAPLSHVCDIRKIGEQLYVTCLNGIGALDENGFHVLDALPLNNNVWRVMSDFEGNLWFTSTRQGVMKIVPNRFIDVFSLNSLEGSVVNTTCRYRDQLFIGTDSGLTVVDMAGPVESIPLVSAVTASGVPLEVYDLLELLDGVRIRSCIRDSQGRMWISTFRGVGLICYDYDHITLYNQEDGLLSDHVRAVTETDDGDILVVNTGGVSVIRDGAVIRSYSREDGINNQESLTVASARNGDILLGSNGDGIYVINDQSVRLLTQDDGLTSGIVMRIKRDDKRNIFWIVTSNSLAWMDEDYNITTISNFPYSNNFDLYENSQGDMWVLASDGIYAASVDALLANENIDAVHFTLANGLQCTASSNSYSELTSTGDLYMAGTTGVVKVNIDAPLENINTLKVAVPYMEADDEIIYADSHGRFVIPAGVRKLRIHSNILSFSLNDLQVSYHLEGFDLKEVTLKRTEMSAIDYTNLPGGSYRFVIHISDSLGRGSKTVYVPVVKIKTVYEQPWFYFMVFVAFCVAVAAMIRMYVANKAAAYEKKQAEAVEKERLNTELSTARAIQGSMMPNEFPPFPDRKEFDIYATMNPAREVGGDFYDFFMIDDDHLCMVIADVSGKGIPASLFMMISKIIVQSCAMLRQDAGEILTKTNDALCSNNKVDMFVTIWLGILEISTGVITAANAGHEYPALMKNGKFALLKDKHGLVIGGMPDIRYKQYEIDMKPGDKLFVYTDGVPEGTAANKQMFTTDRMIDALNRDPEAPVETVLENVQKALDDFVGGAEQFDDVTMLCFQYNGSDKDRN